MNAEQTLIIVGQSLDLGAVIFGGLALRPARPVRDWIIKWLPNSLGTIAILGVAFLLAFVVFLSVTGEVKVTGSRR